MALSPAHADYPAATGGVTCEKWDHDYSTHE